MKSLSSSKHVKFSVSLHYSSSTRAEKTICLRTQTHYGAAIVGRSQLEHGQEVCGVLFVSRSEPPEVFDAIE